MLVSDEGGPEGISFESLCDARGSEMGIGPGCSVVAVLEGPVALVLLESLFLGIKTWGETNIPVLGPVKGLSYIVIAFAVATH
jgi:hypothetical protein